MSRTKQVIDLSSPSMNNRVEKLVGIPQSCGYCQGNGWFWGLDDLGQSVKNECPLCGGSGMLVPEITVEWKPVKHIEL